MYSFEKHMCIFVDELLYLVNLSWFSNYINETKHWLQSHLCLGLEADRGLVRLQSPVQQLNKTHTSTLSI